MLAGLTNTPELALEQSETDTLAAALDTVNSFYRVAVAEKTLAWINLAMVAGGIYGIRMAAASARRRSERGPRATKPMQPAQVINPVGAPPTADAMSEERAANALRETGGFADPPEDFVPFGFHNPTDLPN